MSRLSGFCAACLALVLGLAVGAQTCLAADYYFGNFEDDVMFGGEYILDTGAEGYAGWRNWGYPAEAPAITSASPSTTYGVTTGANSIAWQPTNQGYHQGLAVKIQDLPAPTRDAFFDAFFANTHIGMNVTWVNDEWFLQYDGEVGGWNGAEVGLAINFGPDGTYADQSFPDIDEANESNPGHWDLDNYSGTHLREVFWDYSAYKDDILAMYQAATMNETAGWLEFMLYTNQGAAFNLPVTYYIDSWRLTTPASGVPGDYNNNGVTDAADYALWRDAMEAEATDLVNRNPSNTGMVGEPDFDWWRENFGSVLGAGAGSVSAAVPEPSTLLLAAWAVCLVGLLRRKSR